nr:uncharacterized protein I203_06069 [Kwoniella mangroviensis CBS 8507]OCF64825.1 hypothetical protein I203_06069 [Kwoniella mangroviensis CBS 8507]
MLKSDLRLKGEIMLIYTKAWSKHTNEKIMLPGNVVLPGGSTTDNAPASTCTDRDSQSKAIPGATGHITNTHYSISEAVKSRRAVGGTLQLVRAGRLTQFIQLALLVMSATSTTRYIGIGIYVTDSNFGHIQQHRPILLVSLVEYGDSRI